MFDKPTSENVPQIQEALDKEEGEADVCDDENRHSNRVECPNYIVFHIEKPP